MNVEISRRKLLQASAGLALPAGSPLMALGSAAHSTPDTSTSSAKALVNMSPQHDSMFALPGTTIAIRGVTLGQIGNIYVTASLSGAAAGVLREHSDGQGVTWDHDATFLETETVTVKADVPLTNASDGAATFVIGEQAPRPASTIYEDRTSAAEDDSIVHNFKSRPDLNPVRIDIGLLDESRISPGLMAVTPHVPNG